MNTSKISPGIYEPIRNYISSVVQEFEQIPLDRKRTLQTLIEYIQTKLEANQPVKLIFICTHNSRRSHLSQIWAQIAACYYSIYSIDTYSGGTEATAFNIRAVKALQKIGFQINKMSGEVNPIYQVQFAEKAKPIQAFSKVYDAAGNPKTYFAAIMTCSQADENCPFIPGADTRIAIAYDDPKNADESLQEEAVYDERTRQIGREMLFVFSKVSM